VASGILVTFTFANFNTRARFLLPGWWVALPSQSRWRSVGPTAYNDRAMERVYLNVRSLKRPFDDRRPRGGHRRRRGHVARAEAGELALVGSPPRR
jgi:hypothetical protein